MRNLDNFIRFHFNISDDNDEKLFLDFYSEIKSGCTVEIFRGETSDISSLHIHSLVSPWIKIPGAGIIAAKYIQEFKSERARSYLYHFMVDDKIKGCGKLFLELYYKFRESPEHYSLESNDFKAQANHMFIVTRYDLALRKVVTKDMVPGLIELAKDPVDIAGLDGTLSAVARKYHPEELEKISIEYLLSRNNVWEHKKYETSWDAHFDCTPILVSMHCLEHYPSQKNIEIISKYIDDKKYFIDKYTAKKARKSIDKINKKLCK